MADLKEIYLSRHLAKEKASKLKHLSEETRPDDIKVSPVKKLKNKHIGSRLRALFK